MSVSEWCAELGHSVPAKDAELSLVIGLAAPPLLPPLIGFNSSSKVYL